MNNFSRIWNKQHGMTTSQFSNTNKLVLGSILGAIAAILQSAGLLAGVGYVFSTLATGPIILATILSVRIGLLTYALTPMLLMIIQPTEVFVFLFTTGLLAVGIGIGFKTVKISTLVAVIGGLCLTAGIVILLTLFNFPVLGPSLTEISVSVVGGVLAFSIAYSWIWMRISLIGMKYMNRVIVRHIAYEK
ncbi:hypothetical protein [Robertmurraya korlensis]|uniref:hypothetical protein n=1 Tax=Robertmurraya korlensis TaxID=519977 RepID=UPI00082458E3|nr:hypothetical protein [Robertmurraya korlensis]